MSSDAPQTPSAQDIQVRLKPVLGVDPKIYLAVIYVLIILAVLFGVTLWPGLSHPGTKVTVTSTPPGAAVIFNGHHYGTTPVAAFLPEGQGKLEVSKPGFGADTRDLTVGNNVFLSLLFPKTAAVTVTLKADADDRFASLARAEIGRWALALPFTSTYRFPPLFTRFAADAQAAGWDQAKIQAFLLSVRSEVADPQMYLDYGRALGLWKADASAPEGLDKQFDLWSPLVGSDDRLALWLLANQTKVLRDREATASEQSDWLKARIAGVQASLKASATPTFAAAPGSLKAGGASYHGVGAATFAWASAGTTFSLPVEPPFVVPVPATTAAFWIADAEVTQGQFAAFVAAVPQWAPASRDALVAAGKADADYLKDWTDGKPAAPAEPVANVSWYAAQAYCAWLNASGQTAGKKATLPDDFQWEAAARSPGGASMLNQGVWEWTASAFGPADALVWTDAKVAVPAEAYARSLKGGATMPKASIVAGDRAGWPAAGTTAALGFRVALVSP